MERKNSQKLSTNKCSPKERKLIRSVSDLVQVKFSAMKFKKHSRTRVAKKEMAKDWHNTYLEMCARAHMLEDALDKASKNDLKVRPVNRFAKDIEEENMKESRKKHRTKGAETGSFFSIHSIESACTMEMEEKLSNNSLEDEKRVETNEIFTDVKILLKKIKISKTEII